MPRRWRRSITPPCPAARREVYRGLRGLFPPDGHRGHSGARGASLHPARPRRGQDAAAPRDDGAHRQDFERALRRGDCERFLPGAVPQHGGEDTPGLHPPRGQRREGTEAAGVTPLRVPIRGGTDGAQLSWEGLPCPNLGTGGYAFHGPYEHITVEGMDKCVEIIRRIVEIYA